MRCYPFRALVWTIILEPYISPMFLANNATVRRKFVSCNFICRRLTCAVIARIMLLFWWLNRKCAFFCSHFALLCCWPPPLVKRALKRSPHRPTRHQGDDEPFFFYRRRDDEGRRAAASAFRRPSWADVGDVASLRRKRLPRAHSLGVTGWEETACSNVTTPPCRGFIAPFLATVFHVKERLARRFGRCS